MKAIFLALTLATAVSAAAQTTTPRQSLPIGSVVPKAEVMMRSTADGGRPVSLQSVAGKKGLLVMFSCNTCPFVVKSQARTQEMISATIDAGVGMVIVNSNEAYRDGDDSYDQMRRYASGQGYRVPYVLDQGSALADAFGASRTPEVFLFNAEGKLVYKGAMEDNPAEPGESQEMFLRNAIKSVVAGKSPEPAETKSIGCSIKRRS